ncbi:protein SRC2-like [Cornus florida]|uniref:protein SRC2-like n=1 Tax=Cornus florida TaxID=4283 RepID=UPI00289F0F11|nr:protein SRC2-like [Cornus florida]
MECRKFEITLVSANDLEDVRRICKMKPYARVSIANNPRTEKRTPTDKHGETNPAWNFTVRYTIDESAVEHYGVILVIKLYCKRKLGDRYIGEVHTSLKELFDYASMNGGSAVVSHPVQKGSADSQGVLKFSYRFGDRLSVDKLVLADSIALSGYDFVKRDTCFCL